MPSFPTQLALSGLLMGGVVLGLYFVGQSRSEQGSSSLGSFGRAAHADDPAGPHEADSPPRMSGDPRAFLPAHSWLVIDFDGRLTGASPFSSASGDCARVPPPDRVGLAIGSADGTLPTAGGLRIAAGGTVLSLASPTVSSEFWRCVRSEVLAAGGRVLSTGTGEEALESPSGVLVHGNGRLLFASDPARLRELSELARGQAPSAASAPPHPALAASVSPDAGAAHGAPAPLLATLHLPTDWLADLGPEALETPLRHLRAGALRADAEGGATGTLECQEPGCEELAAFLLRARSDLGRLLPGSLGAIAVRSWTAAHQPLSPTRGMLRLRWTPADMSFADWVSELWKVAAGAQAGSGSGRSGSGRSGSGGSGDEGSGDAGRTVPPHP